MCPNTCNPCLGTYKPPSFRGRRLRPRYPCAFLLREFHGGPLLGREDSHSILAALNLEGRASSQTCYASLTRCSAPPLRIIF
jgi:hypothetical protein